LFLFLKSFVQAGSSRKEWFNPHNKNQVELQKSSGMKRMPNCGIQATRQALAAAAKRQPGDGKSPTE